MPEYKRKRGETALDPWWSGYRKRVVEGGIHRVETFVRSHTPAPGTHSRRERFFRELEQRVGAERFDGYDVTVLGDELCLCENCRTLYKDETFLDTVTDLAAWRDGGIRSSGFIEEEIQSSVTGEQYRVVVPPEIALGIYVDDELAGVFPCVAAGINYRPETYLDGLAAGRLAVVD